MRQQSCHVILRWMRAGQRWRPPLRVLCRVWGSDAQTTTGDIQRRKLRMIGRCGGLAETTYWGMRRSLGGWVGNEPGTPSRHEWWQHDLLDHPLLGPS